jgi:hypothetical protein
VRGIEDKAERDGIRKCKTLNQGNVKPENRLKENIIIIYTS